MIWIFRVLIIFDLFNFNGGGIIVSDLDFLLIFVFIKYELWCMLCFN